MVTDIRLSVTFWGHPKTVKLERRLGLPAVKALIQLWMWAANHRPDGDLAGMDDEDIAITAELAQGQPAGDFVVALAELRWLDGQPGAYQLHDWLEHNPWAADSEDRANEARLMKLAQVNKPAADELRAKGFKGITKEEYRLHKTASRQRHASVTQSEPPASRLAPAPSPLPLPVPEPTPEEEEGISDEIPCQQPSASPPPVDDCPHEKILAIYHEVLPELPRVMVWGAPHRAQLKARWREDRARQNLDWWRRYFASVQESDFLMGRTEKPWVGCNLSWLVGPRNMAKVLNEQYRNRGPSKYSEAARSTARAAQAWLAKQGQERTDHERQDQFRETVDGPE